MSREKFSSGRLDIKDVLDPYLIVLHCPFNLLCIFKDGAHQSKTEFLLGPGSDVKLFSDTDKPRPPPMRLYSASRSGGWQELTNNRVSRFGGFFAGKYRTVGSWKLPTMVFTC